MPERLAIDPTDRSKSPMTMTIVMVKAMTASMETCCEMFSQLRAVMNVSGMLIQKNRMTTNTPIKVP